METSTAVSAGSTKAQAQKKELLLTFSVVVGMLKADPSGAVPESFRGT
jgi:hypothetical protein